jgi:hypothetical protein
MERKEAIGLGLSHYDTGRPCKHGHFAQRRVNDRVCMACDRVSKKKDAVENTEHHRAKKQASYYRTREHHLAQKRVYRQQNKGRINALATARKQYVKQRTPKWADKTGAWLLKEAYQLAEIRTKMTGIAWHVDHIIPLQGKNVSGLHIIDNVQVILGIDNIRKKNHYAE